MEVLGVGSLIQPIIASKDVRAKLRDCKSPWHTGEPSSGGGAGERRAGGPVCLVLSEGGRVTLDKY